MPDLKVPRAIRGDPDFAVTILPDQDLQRQVDRDARRSDHEWSAGFRIAEDQQFGWPHFDAGLFRLTAVIDQGKQLDALRLQDSFQFLNGFVHRVVAGYGYNSVL